MCSLPLPPVVHDVDPVYSLLKCAADLPRQKQGIGAAGHGCCMRATASSGPLLTGSLPSAYNSDNITVRNSSRSSSPSSGETNMFKRVIHTMAKTTNVARYTCIVQSLSITVIYS